MEAITRQSLKGTHGEGGELWEQTNCTHGKNLIIATS